MSGRTNEQREISERDKKGVQKEKERQVLYNKNDKEKMLHKQSKRRKV